MNKHDAKYREAYEKILKAYSQFKTDTSVLNHPLLSLITVDSDGISYGYEFEKRYKGDLVRFARDLENSTKPKRKTLMSTIRRLLLGSTVGLTALVAGCAVQETRSVEIYNEEIRAERYATELKLLNRLKIGSAIVDEDGCWIKERDLWVRYDKDGQLSPVAIALDGGPLYLDTISGSTVFEKGLPKNHAYRQAIDAAANASPLDTERR